MEQAATRGEDGLPIVANLLDRMASYVSVLMTEKEWRIYEAMPGFTYGDHRTHSQVYADLNARERYLLSIARKHGVFARAPELEMGDASSLDIEEVEA